MTKILILGILFLTEERALVVARLVILGIFPFTSFVSGLREVFVAKLVILSISPSIYFTLALYTSFLTTSFLPHYLIYLNQQEKVNNEFISFTFEFA